MSIEKNNRLIRFIVKDNSEEKRLDSFLADFDLDLSRSQIKKLISLNAVLINKTLKSPSYKPAVHDEITVDLSSVEKSMTAHQQDDIQIEIVFEDADIIVVNKSVGLVTHPGAGNEKGTLVNALFDKLYKNDEIRPGVVHRLDKETSGLLVLAKTEKAYSHLIEQFKEKSAKRTYWALCFGRFKNKTGTVKTRLSRHPKDRKKFSSQENGKIAITHFEVLSEEHMSLVELNLETGRTHQIRVHLSEMGHPILNDPVYSSSKKINDLKDLNYKAKVKQINRMCLVARKLRFTHPTTLKEMHFETHWPEELLEITPC